MTVLSSVLPFGLLLAVLVTAVVVFDMRWMIIPDPLNLALAVGGCSFQLWKSQVFTYSVFLFPSLLFLSFFVLRVWFVRTRGMPGLGLGDVKMAGACAFWISPWNLAPYILISCASALLFVLYRFMRGSKLDLTMRVPFGPFLGLGLLAMWALENSGVPTFVPVGGH